MKLAIDLGGTNIRIAQVEDGKILSKKSVSCFSSGTEEQVLSQLFSLIESMMNEQVIGIGIGVPSVVNHIKGIVYNVTNIPSWKEVHLKDILQNKFPVQVSVNNDSNCFVLGEKLYGEGKQFKNLVGVTLGTGVGAGVIMNDQLYCGDNTGAGEIGSLPYLDSDFEHYCSSYYFIHYYNTTGREACMDAINNNSNALNIWREFGKHLGELVKVILYTYDPTAIVFGGSISAAFSFFIDSLRETIADFPYANSLNNLHLLSTKATDISLLGASALIP